MNRQRNGTGTYLEERSTEMHFAEPSETWCDLTKIHKQTRKKKRHAKQHETKLKQAKQNKTKKQVSKQKETNKKSHTQSNKTKTSASDGQAIRK